MWQYQRTDELYHYGVPGMKWGRRKMQMYYTNRAKRYRSMANNETRERNKVLKSGTYSQKNIDRSQKFSNKMAAKADAYRVKANAQRAALQKMNKTRKPTKTSNSRTRDLVQYGVLGSYLKNRRNRG